jgi:glutaredoxin
MTSDTLHIWPSRVWIALILAAGGLASPLSQAQQVFRSVGPEGKVTFSDQAPPASVSKTKVTESNAGPAAGAAASDGLPFELRQVALKYPVVFYAADNCAPCGSARAFLASRGVPFSEKTVRTAQDHEALQRLSGEASLPFMTIGSQQLKGFSDAEWTQFLNAAGYPKLSMLPASYRKPAAVPLVAAVEAVASPAATASATRRAGPAPVVAPAAANNPAGIRF